VKKNLFSEEKLTVYKMNSSIAYERYYHARAFAMWFSGGAPRVEVRLG
jgi:hypothetical protein